MSSYEDLRGAAANTEIILDDQGVPSVMVKQPLVYLDELGIGEAHTPHPAFVINDKVVPYIYLPAYLGVIKNNRAYSLPNQDPANYVTYDRAVEVCANRGAGWHLMTGAEWGLVHNMITAAGEEPRGNTNNGRSHAKTYEHGVLSPTNQSGAYRTLTGTGGKTWAACGINDLVGNVSKWIAGVRLVEGEIQVIPNNNAAIHKTDLKADSAAWKAILQDGSFVAPGTVGTLKFDYSAAPAANTANFYLSTTIENKQTEEAHYGYKDFGELTAKTGVTVPDILKALALFPNTDKTGRGGFWMRNMGERLLFRGGYYGDGGSAGEAHGALTSLRSYSSPSLGLFPAYVDPALYA